MCSEQEEIVFRNTFGYIEKSQSLFRENTSDLISKVKE